MKFDLTREQWLPVIDLNGETRLVGIEDALVQAHEYRELADPSPLVTLALHRLLLAVVQRVFAPANLDEWKNLYRAGRFDPDLVRAYLERWRERFDLFHPERPFYQVRGLDKLGYGPDPVTKIVLERSNYGAPADVFEHPRDPSTDSLSPAEAARWLLAFLTFAPGGLVKKTGEPGSASAAPLNRGAACLVQGDTLFATLTLNTLVVDAKSARPIPASANDAPAWEGSPLSRPSADKEPRRTPTGWLDVLTWQSRRAELTLLNGRVSGIIHCVGQGRAEESALDPMLAWTLHEKRGRVPVEFSENRLVFRDLHALLQGHGGEHAGSPAAVAQLSSFQLRNTVEQSARFRLQLLGMKGDQASIKFSRRELFDIPLTVLRDPDLVERIREATKLVEQIAWSLTISVRDAARATLAPGARNPDEGEVRELAARLGVEENYWSGLAAPFSQLIATISSTPDDALGELARAAGKLARAELAEACRALGPSGRALKGSALAERSLGRRLRELLAPMEIST